MIYCEVDNLITFTILQKNFKHNIYKCNMTDNLHACTYNRIMYNNSCWRVRKWNLVTACLSYSTKITNRVSKRTSEIVGRERSLAALDSVWSVVALVLDSNRPGSVTKRKYEYHNYVSNNINIVPQVIHVHIIITLTNYIRLHCTKQN